eukprot:TRINITY_DN25819_c0_g1_i1.p1 TRINITY_DN25819_c0_g1~~TRINITY_DN25819_c0_g1_i1.p1  ORF type:complete len:381 (+),score=118.57 TRINITY_DN25819_c0_g1_i1:85-1143(+)
MRGQGPYGGPQRGGGNTGSAGDQWRDLCGQCHDCFGGCCGFLKTAARMTPLCCRVTVGLCVLVFIGMIFAQIGPVAVCSGGAEDLQQPWRLFSAPLVHLDIMHLLMNSIACWSLLCGSDGFGYENAVGTAATAALMTFFTIAAQALALVPAAVAHYLFHSDQALGGMISWTGCAAGLSCALFAFLTLSYRKRGIAVPCCGFMLGPAVYPFVMLLVVSIILPGVFFLGHLSGIILGFWVDDKTFFIKPITWLMRQLTAALRVRGWHSYREPGEYGPPVCDFGGFGGDQQSQGPQWGAGQTLGGGGGGGSQQRSSTYPPHQTGERTALLGHQSPPAGGRPPGDRRFPGQGHTLV